MRKPGCFLHRVAGCAKKRQIMIPNLNELPPVMEETPPLRKLVRPLLGGLIMISLMGGLIWLYTIGIRQEANQEMNVMGGLRSVAQDIWTAGTAPEVRVPDPDLITEMGRLRGRVVSDPEILVLPAENRIGQARATHELLYLTKERQIIMIRILLDEAAGKVDLLSYQTSPEFADSNPGR